MSGDKEKAENAIKIMQEAAWERLDEIEELIRHGLSFQEIARETDIPLWALEWVLLPQKQSQ